MEKINLILEKSAELNRLQNDIKETFKERDKSPQKRALWSTACENFHNAFDELFFPGGYATFLKLRQKDAKAIELAIDFLIADPVHFRSGYLKEEIWRRLPSCSVSDSDKARVEIAALNYLNKIIRREFWYMCRAMSRIGSTHFWQDVAQHMHHINPKIAKRASYLFAYKGNVNDGERLRQKIKNEFLLKKYSKI